MSERKKRMLIRESMYEYLYRASYGGSEVVSKACYWKTEQPQLAVKYIQEVLIETLHQSCNLDDQGTFSKHCHVVLQAYAVVRFVI